MDTKFGSNPKPCSIPEHTPHAALLTSTANHNRSLPSSVAICGSIPRIRAIHHRLAPIIFSGDNNFSGGLRGAFSKPLLRASTSDGDRVPSNIQQCRRLLSTRFSRNHGRLRR
ncbi:hypothetical protein V2J09_021178 [Rumex salicifolius]